MKIVQETENWLMLWKDPGIPAVPIRHNPNSAITCLIEERPELRLVQGFRTGEYGLLNRLDNETEGILLVAKTDAAFDRLHQAMKAGEIDKIYLALCHNTGSESKGVITLPIAHHLRKKKLMTIAAGGRFRGHPQFSQTYFEKVTQKQAKQIWEAYLENKIPFPDVTLSKRLTWMLCRIRQGKRHQIRLHLSAVGYPIVDDRLYSPVSLQTRDPNSCHKLYAIGMEFLRP